MSKIVTFSPLFCETLPRPSWISYILPSEVVLEALADIHASTQTHTHLVILFLFVFMALGYCLTSPPYFEFV